MEDHHKDDIANNIDKLQSIISGLLSSEIEKTGWSYVDDEIQIAFNLLKKKLYIIKEQLDNIGKRVSYTSFDFEDHCIWFDDLYERVDICKRIYGRFFSDINYSLIRNYVFMKQLLDTFIPLERQDIHIVISSEGYFSHTEITDILSSPKGWLDSDIRDKIIKLSFGNQIHWITSSFDQELNKQICLAHEILHAFIKKSTATQYMLEKLCRNNFNINYKQISELFCDCASAYHFGPCYAYGFLEEIRYIKKIRNNKSEGISRLLRAKVVNRTFDQLYSHPLLKPLKDFIRQYKHEEKEQEIPNIQVDQLCKKFIKHLSGDLRNNKCEPEDNANELLAHLKNRLPYYFTDIRRFLNNLPLLEDLETKEDQEYFKTFVDESVRISFLLNEFINTSNEIIDNIEDEIAIEERGYLEIKSAFVRKEEKKKAEVISIIVYKEVKHYFENAKRSRKDFYEKYLSDLDQNEFANKIKPKCQIRFRDKEEITDEEIRSWVIKFIKEEEQNLMIQEKIPF